MIVTVVTAVRNAAGPIRQTLESVRLQEGVDIEHVVIDGASTDGTADIARSSIRSGGKVISERDSGIYDAFNKGLRNATGDVIVYLNAGDFYVNRHSVASMVKRLALTNADVVYGDIEIVDQFETSRVIRCVKSGAFTLRRLTFGFMPAHPAMFVTRTAYERVGEFDCSYRHAGDFEWCVRAIRNHDLRYEHVPEVVTKMVTGGATNNGFRSKWINTVEMRRACRSNSVTASWVRLLSRLPAKAISQMIWQ